jgi:hypothetical protein
MLIKSKAFPVYPARILSLSDSSEPFAGNFWTTFYSGMRLTWSESWKFSKITTTVRVRMRLSTVTRPLKSAVAESHNLLRCTVTHGKSIAAFYSNFRLPLE